MDAKYDMAMVPLMSTCRIDLSSVDAHLHVFSRLCHIPHLGCLGYGSRGPMMWGEERRASWICSGLGRSMRCLPQDHSITDSCGRTVRSRCREEMEGERRGVREKIQRDWKSLYFGGPRQNQLVTCITRH